MTEHSKIDRKSAERAHKSASLFERADAAFGLDQIGPAAVPGNLPKAKRPRQRLQRAPETRPTSPDPAPTQAVASQAPKVEKSVSFKGQRLSIERDKLRDAGLIVPEEPVTGLLEEFRIVKRELLADARAANDDPSRRVLVCSPHSGEGKTYCATNLALALSAERDIEVVLVDADVINPSVSRRLGIEQGAGLMDALADASINPEDLVSPTDIDGLFVMQAGTGSARDAEYLTSARTGEVLDRLTRGAPNRFLVFDTPPALAASPAAELAAYAGQALLVVRADETSRAALDDARQLLSACPDIKLLLNAAQFSPSGRRFGDYGEREE
ncbi:probable exopolysaccharide biosynthesis protein [Erythrobacter sp. NAP1]|uniref:P-loop NTPase n=1 Tax=Erythrobacter sp. NAP1 TaxID=237727 RepID=UPI0000686E9F|nr:P-loop NTPase [Erythrobacter sp. NAP1]EAQ30324.1 probable exopolysaccharide biosynthesis protein [Erythrobacter sp. NAP1]